MREKTNNSNPEPIEKCDAVLKKSGPNHSENEERLLNLIAEIIVEIIMEIEE